MRVSATCGSCYFTKLNCNIACCSDIWNCWNYDGTTLSVESCLFSVQVCCNYIAVKCKNSGVYQYAVSFNPEVDSLRMRYKLIDEQKVHDIIGEVRAFDGRILFLPVQLKNLVIWFIVFCCEGCFGAFGLFLQTVFALRWTI